MKSFVVAATAFAATVQAIGSAVVLNSCPNEVYVHNTPSADGVHTEDQKIVSAGSTYTQEWTALADGCGWSIKLSNSSTDWSSDHIFQYEYTYLTGADDVWFDLSDMDANVGNPWANTWDISSDTESCKPTNENYFHAGSPEDVAGMQKNCTSDASVTVTLCAFNGVASATSAPSSTQSSAESSAASTTSVYSAPSVTSTSAAETSAEETTSEAAPSTTSVAETSSQAAATSTSLGGYRHWSNVNKAAAFATKSSVQATTFATAVASVSSADSGNVVVTVTEVATAYATVVQTVGAEKREVHHQHHVRHPHAGRA